MLKTAERRPAVFPLRVLYSYRHSAIDHMTNWRKKTAKSDGRGLRFLRCFQHLVRNVGRRQPTVKTFLSLVFLPYHHKLLSKNRKDHQ